MILKYVLDANIFITAARTYYSFDFGNKFWDFLKTQAENGYICSIDKVLREIEKVDDALKNWAINDFNEYFKTTEINDIIENYSDIVNYVASPNSHYTEGAINEFLKEENSDAWIIAFAKQKNLIVVTEERSNPQAKRKVFIPDVCEHFNIHCVNTFQMLKELNFKL